MSLKDWLKIIIPFLSLALAGLGGYYDLKSRVTVAEVRIEQEAGGYLVIQQEIIHRLEVIEKKLDCIADKRFCH